MTKSTPKVEIKLRKNKLVAGVDQTVEMLVRITPPELPAIERDRPRLNFGIVLDRSGSMGGPKIANAREAARYCINELASDDRVSLVIFDDKIDVLIPNQSAGNRHELAALVNRITARGSTALHEAWVKGGMEVSSSLIQEGINRVLLITDGLANVGLVNTDEIVSQARGLNSRGVSTSTIGIGDDFNEELLIPMAENAGGNAWHAKSPNDLHNIFEVELKGLMSQFASAVSMGVVPADGVRIIGVLNEFELNENGRYNLPNLQSGSPLDVVVQLRVPAKDAGTKLRLADIKIGYTPQGAQSAEVVKNFIELEYASPEEVDQLPHDESVILATELLINAQARREAIQYLDVGDHVAAQVILKSRARNSRHLVEELNFCDSVLSSDNDELMALGESPEFKAESASVRKNLRYGSYSRKNSGLKKR